MSYQLHALDKARSTATLAAVYASAFGVFYFISQWFPDSITPLYSVCLAMIFVSLWVYLCCRMIKNGSLFDIFWGVAPTICMLYWYTHPDAAGEQNRQLTIVAMTGFWGVRFMFHWLLQWRGLSEQHWLYTAGDRFRTQKQAAHAFWHRYLLPCLIITAGCFPIHAAVFNPEPNAFSALDGLATVIVFSGICISASADRQLRDFLKARRPNQVLSMGAWAYSRHPSVLGHLIYWWGLYLFAIAASISNWWTALGPIAVTLYYMLAIVPKVEHHRKQQISNYEEQVAGINKLIPLPKPAR